MRLVHLGRAIGGVDYALFACQLAAFYLWGRSATGLEMASVDNTNDTVVVLHCSHLPYRSRSKISMIVAWRVVFATGGMMNEHINTIFCRDKHTWDSPDLHSR
jgi:hypothetical protein